MRTLFWLFPTLLLASVNEPMRWELLSGYRNDDFHWHLQSHDGGAPLTYSEHTRDLQYWENALDIRVIYRDIAVFAKGSYGAFGSGELKQRYADLGFTAAQPQFFFSTDAWTLDGWGYFGYSVNLTSDRTYKVILIPFVGCSVDFAHLERSGTKADSVMTSSLPSSLHTTWFGPLIGAFFLIEPGNRLQFEAGYAWHRLHVRLKMERESDLFGMQKLHVKDGGNLAHSGWIRMDYLLSRQWRMGLLAEMQYAASRVLDVSLKNIATGERTPQKFKARWTSVQGSFLISRTF